jgi:hypothetical protein
LKEFPAVNASIDKDEIVNHLSNEVNKINTDLSRIQTENNQILNNSNGTNPTPKPMPATWGPQVRYFSSLARGFIQGYRRGMYKDNNYRVANNCYDKQTQTAITTVLDGVSVLTPDWNSQVTNIIFALKTVTDNCEFDESLYDYLTYCYEGDMCEPQNMMGTLLKKVFQVTTIANDLA